MHARLKEGVEHTLLSADTKGEETAFPRGEHKITRMKTPAVYGGDAVHWIVITTAGKRYGRPFKWWTRAVDAGEIELIKPPLSIEN